MKPVCYARFSSTHQKEESITAQLRAIQEYAAKNRLLIIKKYIDEAKSATADDRPQFLQMIDDIDSGHIQVDYVLVHKDDSNLGRHTEDHFPRYLKASPTNPGWAHKDRATAPWRGLLSLDRKHHFKDQYKNIQII
jgi:predicted site-specific integrase-resolvase